MKNLPVTFQPKRILVVQTALIGDVILITPLISALKKCYPDAAIDVMVNAKFQAVLQNNPAIDNIIPLAKIWPFKMLSILGMVSRIQGTDYDLAVSAHRSVTTGFMLKIAGIPHRIGYDQGFSGKYYNYRVPWPKGMRRVEKNMTLLKPITDEAFPIQTHLYPSTSDNEFAETVMLPYAERPRIAIAPGSMSFTKRWPMNHYAELTRLLYEKGFQLIFLGAPAEVDTCREIIEKSGVEAINMAGRTTILKATAVISKCRMLICNDSGLMHAANAVQTPVVAFFGPTTGALGYQPIGEKDHIFEIDLACRPCGKHGGDRCPRKHHRCMLDIKPETVLQYIVKTYGTP